MKDSLANASERVVLGKVGRVHGIKGWLRLNSFTEPPENIFDYKSVLAGQNQQWQQLEIDEFKQQANGLLVHFKGVDDPEHARQLTGLELSVACNELPELEQDSYYWHQLQGLEVWNQQDELLGRVDRLLETGANDVLVVLPGEGSIDQQERLIPYVTDQVIKDVDIGKGRLTVDWEVDFLE